MKIYNETKTQLLNESECDLENGYLSDDIIITGQRPNLIETKNNPDGSVSSTVYNSTDITEKILVYKSFTLKEKYERELSELEKWFLTEYREMFEKYTRKVTLNRVMKNGISPQTALSDLYDFAETKSDRINQLRILISNL